MKTTPTCIVLLIVDPYPYTYKVTTETLPMIDNNKKEALIFNILDNTHPEVIYTSLGLSSS